MERLSEIAAHARAAGQLPFGAPLDVRGLLKEGRTLRAALMTGGEIDPELKRQLSLSELSTLLDSLNTVQEQLLDRFTTKDGPRVLAAFNAIAEVCAAAAKRVSAGPSAVPPAAGDVEFRYTDLKKIDDGAYADLYRAFDTRLTRAVALKIFRSKKTSTYVIKQARATATIKNEFVVTIYDTDTIIYEGVECDCIVMELIDGDSLQRVLAARQLDAADARRYGAQILSGVELIISEKRYHEDIHAGNVLVRRDGSGVVIVDAQGTPPPTRPASHAEREAYDLRFTQIVLVELIENALGADAAKMIDQATPTSFAALRTLFGSAFPVEVGARAEVVAVHAVPRLDTAPLGAMKLDALFSRNAVPAFLLNEVSSTNDRKGRKMRYTVRVRRQDKIPLTGSPVIEGATSAVLGNLGVGREEDTFELVMAFPAGVDELISTIRLQCTIHSGEMLRFEFELLGKLKGPVTSRRVKLELLGEQGVIEVKHDARPPPAVS
ncbi:MAG: protein kinase [Deltaproteobacteria bacterium]|nr:protein kinase [Deltaproteobacteria bacterium]